MRLFNGTYMYLLRFPKKLQNFKYEVESLRIYEDFVTTFNFYINVTEWLTSPRGNKVSKLTED